MKTHKDLDVYKKAIDLAVNIYKISELFPKFETYGLADQMRRSSVSVSSNIAEGAARQTKKEFIHFLYVSSGSLSELETQIVIANKLGYLNQFDNLHNDIEEIKRLLHGLIKHQKSKL